MQFLRKLHDVKRWQDQQYRYKTVQQPFSRFTRISSQCLEENCQSSTFTQRVAFCHPSISIGAIFRALCGIFISRKGCGGLGWWLQSHQPACLGFWRCYHDPKRFSEQVASSVILCVGTNMGGNQTMMPAPCLLIYTYGKLHRRKSAYVVRHRWRMTLRTHTHWPHLLTMASTTTFCWC